jgi:hypothetical protein
VGIVIALLLTALLPSGPPRTPREAKEQARAEANALVAVDAFFWVLIIGLIITIVVGYL